MNLATFWTQCLEYLEKEVQPDFVFQMWVERMSIEEINGVWVIWVGTNMGQKIIGETFMPKIFEYQKSLSQQTPSIQLRVGCGTHALPGVSTQKSHDTNSQNIQNSSVETPKEESVKKKPPPKKQKNSALSESYTWDHQFTFETLVVGDSNRFAASCAQVLCRAVCDNLPAKRDYNPFVLYGSSGLGKTHMAKAIGARVAQENPDARVRFITAERYISDYTYAAQHSAFDDFNAKYHHLDLLIIDDFQFIAGKEKSMESFFHLFNQMMEENKQIVFTMDVYPEKIDNLSARLKTRLTGGMSAQIEVPKYEMRVEILHKKAEYMKFRLPDDVAALIAQKVDTDVRRLEGAVRKLKGHYDFKQKTVTLEEARILLSDIFATNRQPLTIEQIVKYVADFYQIKMSDLYSKQRKDSIVRPRHMAMFLAREITSQSLMTIAEAFNRKDHTTVINACKKMEKTIRDDVNIQKDYEHLRSILQQN